jgi:hypothetical protein
VEVRTRRLTCGLADLPAEKRWLETGANTGPVSAHIPMFMVRWDQRESGWPIVVMAYPPVA